MQITQSHIIIRDTMQILTTTRPCHFRVIVVTHLRGGNFVQRVLRACDVSSL